MLYIAVPDHDTATKVFSPNATELHASAAGAVCAVHVVPAVAFAEWFGIHQATKRDATRRVIMRFTETPKNLDEPR